MQTEKRWLSGHHYPGPRMNTALLPHAAYVGRKQFDRPPIPVARFRAEDWWENDGAVPAHSQRYPHISGRHPVGIEFDAATQADRFTRGRWHHSRERGVDHLDSCVFAQAGQIGWQRRFYRALFERLGALDVG